MRILPVVTLLLVTTVNPVPRPAAPAPSHLPAFAEAYHESATRMLATGGSYATWAGQGRHFLFFDPAGDGRAAEVFGDLSTASHIAILCPVSARTWTTSSAAWAASPDGRPACRAARSTSS